MTSDPCGREAEILEAVAADRVPGHLREHAASCPQCSECLLVASFLRQAASQALAEIPQLPDPGYLWWRAGVERRAAASKRATFVITVAQRFAVIAAAVVAVPLVGWAWRHARSLLSVLDPAALAPSLPSGEARPGLVIVISLAVLAALALADLSERELER